jgi:hypothetical protein
VKYVRVAFLCHTLRGTVQNRRSISHEKTSVHIVLGGFAYACFFMVMGTTEVCRIIQ